MPSPTAAAFKAYSEGILGLYGSPYPGSAKANGLAKRLVEAVGAAGALQAIGAYLVTADPYVKARKHPLELLVRDAPRYLIEATGTRVRAGRDPTSAHVSFIAQAGGEMRVDDYPLGDPETIARKAVHDYSRLWQSKRLRSVAIEIGAKRNVYAIEELG
ncbi:MAG TPA: hypothetical protein VMU55_06485 [Solirubrobacteraceae bacterium]|nr:hypothetical protein [Solirubrobacteraceae bacterium]